ncbi:MAG TPA: hypothetical protein VF771_01605 [Longimicrobiaceae bacterium]
MDQFSGNGDRRASDDASEAREHVRNVEENREALEAQKRRTDATAPPEVDQPVRGIDTGGMSASGAVSDDASEAARRAEEAELNRRALEEQNRRVQETTPEEIRDR